MIIAAANIPTTTACRNCGWGGITVNVMISSTISISAGISFMVYSPSSALISARSVIICVDVSVGFGAESLRCGPVIFGRTRATPCRPVISLTIVSRVVKVWSQSLQRLRRITSTGLPS